MDFERLQADIQKIVAIVGTVPEALQERAFEALLGATLAEASETGRGQEKPSAERPENNAGHHPERHSGEGLKPIGHYADFLRRTGITIKDVAEILDIEGDQTHFLRQPPAEKKAALQIQWALLLALESAVRTGRLEVSAEIVRAKVQDQGVYDSSNFATTFKERKEYFAQAPSGKDPKRLSRAGEDELARLIKELAGNH